MWVLVGDRVFLELVHFVNFKLCVRLICFGLGECFGLVTGSSLAIFVGLSSLAIFVGLSSLLLWSFIFAGLVVFVFVFVFVLYSLILFAPGRDRHRG